MCHPDGGLMAENAWQSVLMFYILEEHVAELLYWIALDSICAPTNQ